MPESNNETEVDTVLAAIRRLIQEGRPEGQTAAAGVLERLVLTPALRVDGPVEPVVPISVPQASPMGMDLLLAASDTLVLMNALPPAAPAPLGPSDPVEAELSIDPGALDVAVQEPVPPPAVEAATPLSPAHPISSNMLDAELSSDPGALDAAAQQPAPSSVADPEDAPPLPADFGPSDPLEAELPADPGEAEAVADDADASDEAAPPSTLAAEPSLPPLVLAPAQDEPSASRPDGVPAVDTDLGHSGSQDAPPPDSADLVPAQPNIETVAIQDAEAPEPAPTPAAPGGPVPDLLPLPDEATLRALVAEVLREELRGELGEKLTRNLRKLVRREVMQALSLRDR